MRPKEAYARWKKRRGRVPVLVLGDSHATVFNHDLFADIYKNVFFDVTAVSAATVSGLENPNSKTQALPLFRKAMQRSRAKTAITLMGEVDVGFVIWYRAEKYGAPVAEMMRQAVDSYQKLLLELAASRRVICVSTPYPTIGDGQAWGAVANARKDVKASLAARTDLTRVFNAEMEAFCRAHGITYLSLDAESLDERGVVRRGLRNEDALDHHYDAKTYAGLIIGKLHAEGVTLPD